MKSPLKGKKLSGKSASCRHVPLSMWRLWSCRLICSAHLPASQWPAWVCAIQSAQTVICNLINEQDDLSTIDILHNTTWHRIERRALKMTSPWLANLKTWFSLSQAPWSPPTDSSRRWNSTRAPSWSSPWSGRSCWPRPSIPPPSWSWSLPSR